ncbi:M24 family metallopeptidase [Methanogenium cariaci]|uniref:M24 family metallopeptidase n=1 Tax=Methanogenium cariaci TaxID=2197 RepID=UPI000785B618|nr:M24 family metallopeptidase [Methanogenium cariaci]
MTRTFVKGEPSPPEIQEIYDTVAGGQTLAEEMLRPGITGAEVHNAVVDHFTERGGYTTGGMKGLSTALATVSVWRSTKGRPSLHGLIPRLWREM